jgi:NAD(P)-dependent dehydrogenase (short-subunit alcohol dehydrogenase family)
VRRLENKRAIVTGAGAGIGRAIALRMAKEGARLVLADVDGESAEQVAAEIEGDSLVQRTSSEQKRSRRWCGEPSRSGTASTSW